MTNVDAFFETREVFQARKKAREAYLDKIRGSLLGGAAGDALGYPVEFKSWRQIQKEHGEHGIQDYELDVEAGKAIFSDDTQMTLFTANGILYGDTRGYMRGIRGRLRDTWKPAIRTGIGRRMTPICREKAMSVGCTT